MRKTNTLRRASAALALAVGVLAITSTGAGAAGSTPAILEGFSNATALKMKITVPAVDALRASLAKAGISSADLPKSNIAGAVLEQAISVNSASAQKKGSAASAQGFAAPGIGSFLTRSSKSSCASASCADHASDPGQTLTVLEQVAPGGIGTIEVATADSLTTSYLDSLNKTGHVKVDLDATKLLGKGGALEAVGGALSTLASTVNAEVLTKINPVIQQVIDASGDAALKPVTDELKRYITLGQIKPLPDPSSNKLLGLEVLTSRANIGREVRKGTTGLLSSAAATVEDVNVLNGWVTIDTVKLRSEAYANGVKGGASATSSSSILGGTIGGLLNIDIDEGDLNRLTNPATLKGLLRDNAPAGLESGVEDVAAAIDLLYNVAGVTVEFLPTSKVALPSGRVARAEAGTLRITVAPKIPLLANGVTPAGSVVPRLAADDYVSTGLSMVLDFPSVEVEASAGEVQCLGRCINRTGVGTPWLAVLLMFAAAFAVKRYGFAK